MSAAVMSPITLVKTRMEYGGPHAAAYRSTAHAFACIVATDGVRGLWRGLLPTVLTNAPFSALYYMFFTRLRAALHSRPESWPLVELPGAATTFVSGVIAATAATLLTQPTDVVRTRLQLSLPGATRRGAWDTLKHALSSSGPRALLAGAGPRIAKRTLQTALVWTLYEELLPQMSALHALATAQQDADKEATEQAAAPTLGRRVP
jgi:solute carrier family 25 protein 38